MARLALVLAAIVLLPSVILAQGGVQPGGGALNGAPGGRGNNPPVARNTLDPHMLDLTKAMDPANPIALILAARSDLHLTDAQVADLYKVHDAMVHQMAHAHMELDTLGPNPSMKSIDFAHLTASGRDSLLEHRKAVAAANGELHDAARNARDQAMALLTPDQQQRLVGLEAKVRQAAETPHDTGTEDYTKPK